MDYAETVTALFEEIKVKMCEDYCRYPREWDELAEGMELCASISSIFSHCSAII